MLTSTTVALLAVALFGGVNAIFWDQQTIHQLFPDNFTQAIPPIKQSTPCFMYFLKFVEDLHGGQNWARIILDTWGSGVTGLYTDSSHIDYGHFDQCIDAHFQNSLGSRTVAKYAVIDVSLSEKHFERGICVPMDCMLDDIVLLMKAMAPNMRVEFHKVLRQAAKNTKDWSSFELKVLWFLAGILSLAALSTCYEIFAKAPHNPLLVSFSFANNGRQLLDQRSGGAFLCLDGIKAFSFFQIVLFHVFCCGYAGAINAHKHQTLVNDPFYFFTHASLLAVDTFFLISGLLLSYSFMTQRQKGSPFNIVRFYLRRYLRLFPALFAMDLVLAAFVMRVNGPNPGRAYGMAGDLNFYWKYNAYRPLYHLWYIAAEIQLYLVSPLLLFPLSRWGYKWFPAIVAVTAASIIYTKVRIDTKTGYDLEHLPETRCTPWLIGLMLGYVIFRRKSKTKLRVPSWFASFSSILCFGGLLVIMYMKRSPYETSTYTVLSHPIWALLLSWPILLMVQGHLPGLNFVLSHATGQLISKLSYCGYLWHLPVMHVTMAIQRTPIYINGFLQLQFALSVFVISLLISVPWSLLFELPIMNLERIKWPSLWSQPTHKYTLLPSNNK